jgi:hypothetical protein
VPAFLKKVFLRYPVYFSSSAWIRYRQHDSSCCARVSKNVAEYLRLPGDFWTGCNVTFDREVSMTPTLARHFGPHVARSGAVS